MRENRPLMTSLEGDSLAGQILIAMPAMSDERFQRSVIYMCAHSDEGAMGLIINQVAPGIDFADLMTQLELVDEDDLRPELASVPVHIGGPVETGRGFVLHSADYGDDDTTLKVTDEIALTATVDVLKAIAGGDGPRFALLTLGYAGWAPGQLESEIQSNGWLHCGADLQLVFRTDAEQKYTTALSRLGIDATHLVSTAGHA